MSTSSKKRTFLDKLDPLPAFIMKGLDFNSTDVFCDPYKAFLNYATDLGTDPDILTISISISFLS
jgi:hypothetical protein